MPILKCEFMCCYFRLLRSHSEAGYNTSHCVKTWMGFTEKSVTVAIIWSIQSSWFTVVSKAISRFYPDPSRPSHIITDGVSVLISRLQLWWSLSCYRGDPGIITMLFAIFSKRSSHRRCKSLVPEASSDELPTPPLVIWVLRSFSVLPCTSGAHGAAVNRLLMQFVTVRSTNLFFLCCYVEIYLLLALRRRSDQSWEKRKVKM